MRFLDDLGHLQYFFFLDDFLRRLLRFRRVHMSDHLAFASSRMYGLCFAIYIYVPMKIFFQI